MGKLYYLPLEAVHSEVLCKNTKMSKEKLVPYKIFVCRPITAWYFYWSMEKMYHSDFVKKCTHDDFVIIYYCDYALSITERKMAHWLRRKGSCIVAPLQRGYAPQTSGNLWEQIRGALDKYNIYLFISNSTEDFQLNQYQKFQLILSMHFHFMRYFVNNIISRVSHRLLYCVFIEADFEKQKMLEIVVFLQK